jgi:hypothetical protein
VNVTELVVHVAPAAGILTEVVLILRFAPKPVLLLVAGLVGIFAPDKKRSRADRALEVFAGLGWPPRSNDPADSEEGEEKESDEKDR